MSNFIFYIHFQEINRIFSAFFLFRLLELAFSSGSMETKKRGGSGLRNPEMNDENVGRLRNPIQLRNVLRASHESVEIHLENAGNEGRQGHGEQDKMSS